MVFITEEKKTRLRGYPVYRFSNGRRFLAGVFFRYVDAELWVATLNEAVDRLEARGVPHITGGEQ